MSFVKRLNPLITVKRKTNTDKVPTGFLGANSIENAMLQESSVSPDKVGFKIPCILFGVPTSGVTALQVVRFNGTNWVPALADTPTDAAAYGIIVNSYNNLPVDLVTEGPITGFVGLTPGATYYLSQSTPGAITATAPTSGLVITVGTAINATTLNLELSSGGIYNAGTGPTTIDFSNGSFQALTMTANITAFNNGVIGKKYVLVITSNGSAFTFPASVTWPSGMVPTATTNGTVNVYEFYCVGSNQYLAEFVTRDENTENAKQQVIAWALSFTPLTGDSYPWIRVPFAHTLVGVYAVAKTAGSTQTSIGIDVASQASVDSGTPSWSTIFSTPVTIDATKLSSTSSATQAVFSTTSRNSGDHYRVNATAVGTGVQNISLELLMKRS